jgi:GT2 family glycosyltransferase
MPSLRPTVSVLVVSYNTRELTLAALTSVARETSVPHEVIVVDNASSDGSAAAIASHPSAPRLVALDENNGFARANNLAAEQATGELLLLLNPDTLVLDGAIDRLVAFAWSEPHAMIWGGRTLFADGRLNPASCWARMTLWSLFCRASGLAALAPGSERLNGEAYGAWQRDRIREVDIVSGCFLLVPRWIWQALDGFDPLFFMYGEEADLCLRARALGARPAITPDATIVHIGGASEPARAGKMVKLLAAKATLIERHFAPRERPLALALLALWPLTRCLATTCLAAITGSARYATAAQAWREIWSRRDEWRRGYGVRHPAQLETRARGARLKEVS